MMKNQSEHARDTGSLPHDEADENLSARAYRLLEERLVTLALKPGEILTEARLMAALDMGRTPVREAVQRLSWEGLLAIRPRHGIEVTQLDPKDYPRVIAARNGLEQLLTSSAARLASPPHREALKACAAVMRQAAATTDTMEYYRQDKIVDGLIADASANPFAVRALIPLQTHSRRFWFRYHEAEDLTEAVALHVEWIDTITSGDIGAATTCITHLLANLQARADKVAG